MAGPLQNCEHGLTKIDGIQRHIIARETWIFPGLPALLLQTHIYFHSAADSP